MKGKNRVSLWSREEVEEEGKEEVFRWKGSLRNHLWLGVPLWLRLHDTAKSWLVFLTIWPQKQKYIHTQFLHLKYHISLKLCLWIAQGEEKRQNRAKTRPLAFMLNPQHNTTSLRNERITCSRSKRDIYPRCYTRWVCDMFPAQTIFSVVKKIHITYDLKLRARDNDNKTAKLDSDWISQKQNDEIAHIIFLYWCWRDVSQLITPYMSW